MKAYEPPDELDERRDPWAYTEEPVSFDPDEKPPMEGEWGQTLAVVVPFITLLGLLAWWL